MSALFDKLAAEPTSSNDNFDEFRRQARRELMSHGFPDLKTEEWKYTSLRVLEKREFAGRPIEAGTQPDLPFDAAFISFVGGRVDPDSLVLPQGVRLEPLQPEALSLDAHQGPADAFALLNLARFEQAWHLSIDSDQARPLALVFITDEHYTAAVHPRLVIDVAEGVSATVLEYQQGLGDGLVNVVEDIRVGMGASLEHLLYRQCTETAWVERSRVRVESQGDYRFHALDLGGRLTRHDLTVELTDTQAHAEIDGVALINTAQHVDFHTAIDHVIGKTTSRESFRMLADGNGVGVFNGRIHIHRNADDSHSALNTANLLLSDSARINTKPELEIYAEEVTASHGATIGQLDDSALFYMRSRGIPASEATTLLKLGFATAPLENIKSEPLRKWLNGELQQAL
jgi:Fe-S cluster assembly protein SufD